MAQWWRETWLCHLRLKFHVGLAKTTFGESRLRAAQSSPLSPLARGVVPSLEHRGVLRSLDIDLILDVGANRWQFTLMARLLQPLVRVQDYEPLSGEVEVFRAVS